MTLSYDVQTKTGWGVSRSYGAGGISFRLHEEGTTGSYNYYGLSFMRYLTPIRPCNGPQIDDDIPDQIKPTPVDNPNLWSYWTLAGRSLLVLWKQDYGADPIREWIAYKDLSGDACVLGGQWSGDGPCVTDNSSLWVRVVEKTVNGAKVNELSVYYGDASNPDNWGGCGGSRPGNAVPRDSGTGRKVYFPSYDYAAGASPYPAWPYIDVDDWAAAGDYMTFVQHGGGAPPACTPCTWDRVRGAGVQVTDDGGTLILPDFTTPSSGTFPANRDEVGLHAVGKGGNANNAIVFDEFTIRLLTRGGTSIGGVDTTVMR
jgi:hypothetical protein